MSDADFIRGWDAALDHAGKEKDKDTESAMCRAWSGMHLSPDMHAIFEARMRNLGINDGCLTLLGNRYLNENVQWMFEQFKRAN